MSKDHKWERPTKEQIEVWGCTFPHCHSNCRKPVIAVSTTEPYLGEARCAACAKLDGIKVPRAQKRKPAPTVEPKKYKSSVFCEHANECPTSACTCAGDCACRERMCKLHSSERHGLRKRNPSSKTTTWKGWGVLHRNGAQLDCHQLRKDAYGSLDDDCDGECKLVRVTAHLEVVK